MARPPVEHAGRAAAPGLADGPVVNLNPAVVSQDSNSGDPVLEKQQLTAAIEDAIEQIAALVGGSDEETAAILEFQIAMLEDDALSGPAFTAIAGHEAAASAWSAALAEQISDYEAADDEYFKARAADLVDLRDRVLRNLAGESEMDNPPGAILIGGDITPTRFLEADWSAGGGVALAHGSPSSHAAMLARSRGIPMVTGLGFESIEGHDRALLDGDAGRLILSPDDDQLTRFAEKAGKAEELKQRAGEFLGRPAVTKDGTPIGVMVNIADPDEVDGVDIATCDGVGLMRSEFLFYGSGGLPDEERQYEAYRKVLQWAGGKPVTIRTVDAGGDKPVAGLTIEEGNPFLGLRGIRLSLSRPEVFKVQLRALARVGAHGNLKVMLPMVSLPEEIDAAARLLDACVAELKAEQVEAMRPPLGIMVEVPAVAITPERFSQAAFFSIGSNDLTQYVMAASRESEAVASLHDVGQPAVRALIGQVCHYGDKAGIEVSLCGDAGGDPAHISGLLEAGLRVLSVAPAELARAKMAIADADLTGVRHG
jgi:phosphotransferase system enzyme I (PtsI)